MFPKEFSIVVFLILLLVWIYLFLLSKYDWRALCWLLSISALITALIYNLDNIKNISASKEKGLLVEMQAIKEDFYAKAEDVKEMGEHIAEVGAYTIARQGRWESDDHLTWLVENRNKLSEMLKKIGTNNEGIEKILSEPDKMICWDIWYKYHNEKAQQFRSLEEEKKLSNEDFREIREAMNQLMQMFRNDTPESELMSYLEGKKFESHIHENIATLIKESNKECLYYKKNRKLME